MEPHRAMAEVIDSDPNPFAWKTIEKPTPYHQPVLDNSIRPSSWRQGVRPRGDAQPDGLAYDHRLGIAEPELHFHARCQQRPSNASARANARMALMLAIGELQIN